MSDCTDEEPLEAWIGSAREAQIGLWIRQHRLPARTLNPGLLAHRGRPYQERRAPRVTWCVEKETEMSMQRR